MATLTAYVSEHILLFCHLGQSYRDTWPDSHPQKEQLSLAFTNLRFQGPKRQSSLGLVSSGAWEG